MRSLFLLLILACSFMVAANTNSIKVNVSTAVFEGVTDEGEWLNYKITNTETNEEVFSVEATIPVNGGYSEDIFLAPGSYKLEVTSIGAQVSNPTVTLEDGSTVDFDSSQNGYFFDLEYPFVLTTSADTICVNDFSISYTGIAEASSHYVQYATTSDFSDLDTLITVESVDNSGTIELSLPSDFTAPNTVYIRLSSTVGIRSEATSLYRSDQTLPTSDFEANAATLCFGDTTTITYQGNGSSTATYNWSFDEGTVISGSGQGPYEISWEDSGAKNVSLTVEEHGCTSETSSQEISINAELTASFDVAGIICEGDTATIEFTGTAPEPSDYNWTLDGGTIVSTNDSTLIEVVWTELGTKNISLQIENNNCTSNVAETTLSYNQTPTSSFTFTEFLCFGDTATITYTGNATEEATYSWDFDEGTIISGSGQGPYEISWEDAGSKTVTLSVEEDGCSSDTSDEVITINSELVAAFDVSEIICEGDTATIEFTGTAPEPSTYNWSLDGGTIVSSNDSTLIEVVWTELGTKNISLQIENNDCSSNLAATTISYNQTPTSTFTLTESLCFGEATTITYTGNASVDATYNWDFDEGTVISGAGQGPYEISWVDSGEKTISLHVEENGCASENTAQVVNVKAVPLTPSICIVTIDPETSKNMILWDIDQEDYETFNIYRETNVAGEFSLVATINDLSNFYIDEQSLPENVSNRYKISALDSCGIESDLSVLHKTIHLTINQGLNNSWNLIWDEYEGFQFGTYRINRSINGGDFELLTEVASNLNSFTDDNVPSLNVSYQIEVLSNKTCTQSSARNQSEITSSKSNIARNEVVLSTQILEEVKLFPNPTHDFIQINSSNLAGASYEIISMSGRTLISGEIQSKHHTVSLQDLAKGLYVMKIVTDQGPVTKRIRKN